MHRGRCHLVPSSVCGESALERPSATPSGICLRAHDARGRVVHVCFRPLAFDAVILTARHSLSADSLREVTHSNKRPQKKRSGVRRDIAYYDRENGDSQPHEPGSALYCPELQYIRGQREAFILDRSGLLPGDTPDPKSSMMQDCHTQASSANTIQQVHVC